MPRSAAQPPEQALQGNLFGAPEPAADPQPQRSRSDQDAAATADLSDASLSADARQRPRQRREQEAEATPASDHSHEAGDDTPAWAHHSQVDPLQLTPMLRHYVELKAAHPERVLLYRLGDFFECFFEDAVELSRALELTLTGKEGGKAIGRVPMAGIPHHAAERYCADLIRRGYSVALCDQLETTPAKGALLKRDITRVLTPGTVLEEGMLRARRNNWLAAVVVEAATARHPLRWGLASADVSTGDVQVMERNGGDALHQQLAQLEASELLWAAPDDTSGEASTGKPTWCPERLRLSPMARTPFSAPEAEQALKTHYRLANLDGLGLQELPLALRAFGGLLHYVNDTQPLEDTLNVPLEVPQIVHSGDALILDAQTRRNLELTATQRDGQLQGSLLWAIDQTLTAMCGRSKPW
jgi:DNA mismatch repair protein MutS